MIAPLLLLVLAAVMGGLTFLPSLAGWQDLRLLAVLIGIGAVLLLLRHLLRGPLARDRNWIVVDGSNVLHWEDNTPRLGSVQAVLATLQAQGFVPVVWFDANVGYLIGKRHADAVRMAALLGLPRDHVHVMPRGSPADPALIAGAVTLGALIVTNDRFRDWQDDNPGLPDRLIRGSLRDGQVRLRLPQPA